MIKTILKETFKIAILTIVILSFNCRLFAQDKYWVFLNDKKDVQFNPYEYFDIKAIERRINQGISLYDITDYPLNEKYLLEVQNCVDSISQTSRWFNAIAVYATYDQINIVKNLDFVTAVKSIRLIPVLCEKEYSVELDDEETDLLIRQTERMGGQYFKEKGINGEGIRIAIFDGGFPNVDVHPAFEHIRKEGHIIKTWDFTKNKEHVYSYSSHGTMVLSCIGGIIEGINMGLATNAEFLLARTEVKAEPYSEEENWLAAVEWADKNGADIINSSLGYTYHRYFNFQMDGKSSLVAKAANLAAKKGIIVVNSAANEGDNKWKYIATPADADSVLSVGGISPKVNYHINFSSYGPTTDGRLKPNVSAFGTALVAKKRGVGYASGTSFSSPLVAGFVACAWQMNKDKSNMEMFEMIQKSGDLYPYFDYAHGYGVPQADYFTKTDRKSQKPTFDFVVENNKVTVIIKKEFFRRVSSYETAYIFYNIQNPDGMLDQYYVVKVHQQNVLSYNLNLKKGYKLNVHYLNYTKSYEF